jgi:hypothetical protein
MKKRFITIKLCLLFATVFTFQDCSNDVSVERSSMLKDSDKELFNKISSIYNLPEESVTNGRGGKKLFTKKDVLLQKTELHVTRKGERYVKIPIAKNFGTKSGLAGSAHLMINVKNGLENSYFVSISYPKNSNNNIENPSQFTGTLKFYKIINKKVVSVGGYAWEKGKLTSTMRNSFNNESLAGGRTAGWWDDFTEALGELWDDLNADCLSDGGVIGNALVFAGASIACAAAVAAIVPTAGISTALAVGACVGMAGSEILFLQALDEAGCF